MEFRSNKNIVFLCTYHAVWCPKYRRPVLEGDIQDRLVKVLHEKADELDVIIEELEVMPDHVHALLNVDPQFGIHRALYHMKGYSSHVLRKEFPSLKSRLPSLWTTSYFVSTTGGAPLEKVKEYIENQKGR